MGIYARQGILGKYPCSILCIFFRKSVFYQNTFKFVYHILIFYSHLLLLSSSPFQGLRCGSPARHLTVYQNRSQYHSCRNTDGRLCRIGQIDAELLHFL